MEPLRRWWQERESRRRLRQVEAGVRTCLQSPERLAEVCERLGVSREAMERWLSTLRQTPAGSEKVRPLVSEPLPPASPLDEPGLREADSPTSSESLAERALRLILLLLDLPLAQQNPALASEWIAQLADATAREDRREIAQLETKIERLKTKSFTRSGKDRARDPQDELDAEPDPVSPDLVSRVPSPQEKLASPQALMAEDFDGSQIMEDLLVPVRTHLRQVVLDLAEIYISAPKLFEQELDKIVLDSAQRLIRVELETRAGVMTAQRDVFTERSYLDSLQNLTAGGPDGPQAMEDLLVLVRTRLRQLIFKLAERSVLTPKIVEQELERIVRQAATQFPDLFWSLDKGKKTRGRTRHGEPFRDGVDVAWTLLARAAAGRRTTHQWMEWTSLQRKALRKISYLSETITDLFKTLKADLLLGKSAQTFIERDWVLTLKSRLTGDDALADDPDLAVRLAGALCQNPGTLTWESCIALANSRAKFHRYVETSEDTPWHVQLDVRPGRDGKIEIPFAVVEQPLSSRFRLFFEEQDLVGRVRILWELVHYAATLRLSLLSITAADAQHQVLLREEDLWQTLNDFGAGEK